jgi:ubiquinone/menaquinone biosynthesis C-methylase UbiE
MSVERASNTIADFPSLGAGKAFDRIANEYDQIFTDSVIGRAQRDVTWKELTNTFSKGDSILELNCGTGEDALFLAGQGISVLACDASQQMIANAEQRLNAMPNPLPAVFRQLPTERIGELAQTTQFDGAFSNFSGLNCVADLAAVASSLNGIVKQNGRLVLCFSTRFCVIEILYFIAQGKWRKAFRRCKGYSEATLDGVPFTVYYPTVRQIKQYFAPAFRLSSCIGIGVTVPPSYLESWARRYPTIFSLLRRLEGFVAAAPVLRCLGDHVLLSFEKVPQ